MTTGICTNDAGSGVLADASKDIKVDNNAVSAPSALYLARPLQIECG
jgi:hypothetical protein